MLNAKSGIAEMLLPVGGGASARRQETGPAEDAGLFGDTLKGQMQQAAEAQKPASRETERPAKTTQKAASDKEEEPVATDSEAGVAAAGENTEAAAESEVAAVENSPAVDEDGLAEDVLAPPVATELLAGDESEVATGGDSDLPAETAVSGNILPLPATQVAAGTEAAPEEAPLEELPRWLHSLAAAGRGREQAVAGRTEESGLVAAEDGVQDGAFLKGLQAVTAQLDGQRSEMGGRQPGQGAEAFFKLAGLTVVKEAPPPPLSMAASTVSAAAAATTAPTTAAPAAATPTLTLDVPLRQAGWDQAMAERVVWMAKQGVQEAQIHLNPRNMGPIEVHVSVQKDQASVAFVAQHAATREALDAAMPRLRDMLQDSGLNLAQSEVSQHDRQRDQAAGFAGGQGRGQHAHGGHTGDDVVVAETPLRSGGLGAVDYYA